MLGYRDSGMPDSEANAEPRCFAKAPFDEAVGRLVAIIRRSRPQVILTYGDEQEGYPHPDHLRVHEITSPPSSGPPTPTGTPRRASRGRSAKLYYSIWSRKRIEAHAREVPRARPRVALHRASWFDRPVAGRPHHHAGRHRRLRATCASTRCSPTPPRSIPNSPFWFGLPDDVAESIHPYEDYVLAGRLVDAPRPRTTSSPVCGSRRGPAPEPRSGSSCTGPCSGPCPRCPAPPPASQHVVTGAPTARWPTRWASSTAGSSTRVRPGRRRGRLHVPRDLRGRRAHRGRRARPPRRVHAGQDQGDRGHGPVHGRPRVHPGRAVPGGAGRDRRRHRAPDARAAQAPRCRSRSGR